MEVIALQSGSNGNCIYVQSGGVALLFDAGLSGTQAQQRLAALGRDIGQVQALILSHDHSDHVRCAGVYRASSACRCGPRPAPSATARSRHSLGRLGEVSHFAAGQRLALRPGERGNDPHPARRHGRRGVRGGRRQHRLGILTDLGHVFAGWRDVVGSPRRRAAGEQLRPGDARRRLLPGVPEGRIRGPAGHLSNLEAAELLAGAAGPRCPGPASGTSRRKTTGRRWRCGPIAGRSARGCRSMSPAATRPARCWHSDRPAVSGTRRVP